MLGCIGRGLWVPAGEGGFKGEENSCQQSGLRINHWLDYQTYYTIKFENLLADFQWVDVLKTYHIFKLLQHVTDGTQSQ